ncbi:MAG: hypothetical protein UY65_C0032G0005 [Parcubacteria group bacterium GW2011_GWA2_51_12]|nr:MAG: hypothetical protein UY65_C0032G0005 [Parcubacteria group bacterium GW2011_GWA2_51_12]
MFGNLKTSKKMQRKIRWSVWFSVILVAAFISGYMAWAKANAEWPYDYEYPDIRAAR